MNIAIIVALLAQIISGAPRPTYVASVSGQATTADVVLSIESSSVLGFRLLGWCVSSSSATAAAVVTVTVQRRTTASSGGTALTNEGTSGPSISRMRPGDPTWPGVARLGGTPGTAGAVLDQQSFVVGEIGAGAADPPAAPPLCRAYFERVPSVVSGTANGLSITVSAAGAGGLAAGSISAIVQAGQ